MSDETPTERFEPPTAPLPQGAGGEASAVTTETEGPDRRMLIALIAIAAAILVALVVLIVVLVGNAGSNTAQPGPEITASESESPEPTPTETESPEPSVEPSTEPSATTAPPPPAQSPSFATFTGPDRATCPDTSSAVAITWTWSSTNAVNAWFGIGTNNAKAEPFESVPTTATYTFNYQCSEASQRYTVTLEDSAGRLTHKTVEIVRQ
jgi:cytoskeletal protein RodZ